MTCVGQVSGFFWLDAFGLVLNASITTADGCCALCIADPLCRRYQVAPAGCGLLNTENATAPQPGSPEVSVGLGKSRDSRSAFP